MIREPEPGARELGAKEPGDRPFQRDAKTDLKKKLRSDAVADKLFKRARAQTGKGLYRKPELVNYLQRELQPIANEKRYQLPNTDSFYTSFHDFK